MHHASRNEIVGRVAELSSLDRLVAGIAGGRGDLIWVQGEPGIGKTALVNATLTRASALGCQVLRGGGDELMEPFPLRLMADCLGISSRSPNPSSARIASLLRGESASAGAIDPVIAAAEQMLDLVDEICSDGPVVLVAEDLQWADEASLLVWSRLARLAGQIPLLLIGVTRPLPDRVKLGQLRDLVVQHGGAALDLGPLDPGSAASLASRVVGGKPGPGLSTVLGRAGGNPLYVRELAEALVRADLVRLHDGTAELTGDVRTMPSSLTAAISSRLGFLPGDARKALAVAALLGTEFDATEWAVATDRPVAQIADIARLAVTAGVLSDTTERLRFRHELIHQILVDQTPTAMRRAMHSDIARLLARAGCGADSVARQLLAVPGPVDGWVLDWLADLPETALYGLPRALTDLLARTVESVGEDDRRWETLGVRLARMLYWLGRDEQGREVASAVLKRTTDPVVAAAMRVQIIRSAWRTGRLADGLRAARRLPGDDLLPAQWRARLAAASATVAFSVGLVSRGAKLADEALEQASASGDPLAIGSVRYALAMGGDQHARLDHIRSGLDAVTNRDPESADLRLLLLADYVRELTYEARQEEARRALTEALELADRVGGFRSAAIQWAAAGFCYTHGRWDDALAYLDHADEEFASAGQLVVRNGLAALIALRRGDKPAADARLRTAAGITGNGLSAPVPAVFPLTRALAARAEADGDLPGGVAILSRWLSANPGPAAHDRHNDMPYLVRLTLAAGDTATAAKVAETATADADANGSVSRVAAARLCQAMIADDAGELLAVADGYRAYGWPPSQSFALEEAAVRLAAAGETTHARAVLTDTARVLTGLGATADIRRADARLRPYGVRRGPRSVHRRETTGWESLTPSEVRIAGLVAEGLSNPDIAARLYLSRRTVQSHVSNILSKLQVGSRVDIARAAAERPAVPPVPDQEAAASA